MPPNTDAGTPAIPAHGVGVDATSIRRIAAVIARRPEIVARVFTDAEQRYCAGRPERWASRWAAKEAVRKLAGGRGAVPLPAFRNIEVRMLAGGAPRVVIADRSHVPIALSLTHEGDLAVAVATTAGMGGGPDAETAVPLPRALRLPERAPTAHKGTFGTTVVLAGATGYSGAAYLCAMAAARGGAGLVRLCVPGTVASILAVKCTEVMVHPLPDAGAGVLTADAVDRVRRDHLPRATTLVAGPGLGCDHRTEAAIVALFAEGLPCPAVVDADALNVAAAQRFPWPVDGAALVLTPHPKEMARLMGVGTDVVQGDRRLAAGAYARRHGVVVVLKGSRTVVAAPDGRAHEDAHAVVALATGGTGDVLAGLVGAMLSCGLEAFDAAVAAVTIHAEAGSAAQARLGRAGVLASDVLTELPPAQERVRRVMEGRPGGAPMEER